MRLKSARIQNYRSIKDTGLFQVENLKTIFVGPNESGKTVILQALQQLNQPSDVAEFDELRDYPRSLYNDITTKKVKTEDILNWKMRTKNYFHLNTESVFMSDIKC